MRPCGLWVLDFQRCFGRQDELKDFIAVREYFCLEVSFPHGHAVLNNIINAPPSRLSAQFRTIEIWLGGLDSSRRNLKTTVKLSKLLFSNHLSRFALRPSTTFRNPQRRDSTLNVRQMCDRIFGGRWGFKSVRAVQASSSYAANRS